MTSETGVIQNRETSVTVPDALAHVLASYRNTETGNDEIHADFTQRTWEDPFLAQHRSYIEENKLGYGDAAFHYLWSIILARVSKSASPSLLEIGVYKGQVISLWAALLRRFNRRGEIHAITPLKGSPYPDSRVKRRVLRLLSPRFRERVRNADFHEIADYEAANKDMFSHFGLDWDEVQLHRGLSGDANIRREVATLTFDVVYIDGDHTYAGARSDFEFYAPLVKPTGFLVADDAGVDLPGTTFCKGLPAVSEAAKIIPSLGYRNVLNVGHNCVFQRLD